ncbi:lipoate--protein ligase [Vallitalea pronyensis]|uniref:lipoate--protein ligase n=1 Tax=Vallitalea pronyensis TaxID=1348613 RepID=A0A8J8SFX8_9FIRM|nr:lipoate--protein ligase [Vallitalea pronyensis]QUI22165.1 lipoate--protein ligase [Vallitalea pronyensis]
MKHSLWLMIEVYTLDKLYKTVYMANGFDPAVNLAAEEYLMATCKENEVIMYLWQNEKTVVIGKHQNPLKECHMKRMKDDHIHLIRRKSGGGAVFHDLNNLNFTFIAHKKHYDEKKQFLVILRALKEYGINGCHTGRNDLTVNQMKFSGNAFMHQDHVSCHHGTLLVDAKLDELSLYLTPPTLKLQSKGIDSVRSRVTNLKAFNPTITVANLKDQLVRAFDQTYNGILSHHQMPTSQMLAPYVVKYNDWDWTFAESPKATVKHEKSFSWGHFSIEMAIKNGIIVNCMISTDALLDEPFLKFQDLLVGKKLKYKEMTILICDLFQDEQVKDGLIELMMNMCV